MKFSEIPQFTQMGDYAPDVGLDYLETYIKEFSGDLGLNLEPDFQRGHVWTKEQQIAFVEYLLQGGKSGTHIYMNHPGWMEDFKGEFVLVDGLQRITACLAFIHNEIPVFGHFYNEFEDKMRMTRYTLKMHVNNLKTRKEVLKWYLEMNTGGTVHTKEEIDRVKELYNKEK